ncbi:MAG: FAD-dependent oxidoreductase, partial [Chloroflexi bacterium]|nr:FAD-dependent oxidoreductase [Chloroflexota bacterium]
TVLDEYPRPGGQYFKQLPAAFKIPVRQSLDDDLRRGDSLLAAAGHPNIEILSGTTVWSASRDLTLELLRDETADRLRAGAVVVATGAYDRPVAFPGWDLPGVMTAGAAQMLVTYQRVLPGRVVLLVGSGPFLLPVAKALAEGGARVLAVLEATRPAAWLRHVTRLRGHWTRLREALGYLQALRRARVPLASGWMIVRAEGQESVERAVVARCDGDWRPIPGTERTLAVDAVCLGYGFVPAIQLTRLLDCAHAYRPNAGGWVPVHDADQQTSVPGVFVAGEVAGIGGAHAALAEGRLAGLAAARLVGRPVAEDEVASARRERDRRRRFGDLLGEVFRVRPGLHELMTDDVIVCRCQEVTAGQLRRALTSWVTEVNALKALTRAGMGPCQGRVCGAMVAEIAARHHGLTPDEVGSFHVRAPLRPVPLDVLARVATEEATHASI